MDSKKQLWTLVYKLIEKEYDAIPSSWVLNNDENSKDALQIQCKYPPNFFNSSTITRMARTSHTPEQDWELLDIKIVKSNYDDFERCMTDVMRKTKNKGFLSSSEEKLRSKRISKAKILSPSPETNNSLNKFSLNVGVLKRKIDFDKDESSKSSNVYSRTPNKSSTPKSKLSFPSTSKTVDIENSNPLASPQHGPKKAKSNLSVVKKASDAKCGIKRKHICCFLKGPVSSTDNTTIGKQLCSLSRSMFIFNESLQNVVEVQSDILKALTKKTSPDQSKGCDEEEDEYDPTVEYINDIPFKTYDELMNFDKTLKDPDVEKKAIATIKKLGSMSYTRMVTHSLRMFIHESVCAAFTWKGHKRNEEKRTPFSDLQLVKLITKIAKKKFKVPTEKVEKTISGWLAHAKLNKK